MGECNLKGTPVQDRRVQKTKTLLHGALDSLIREKPYDSIVVQEILDRANVGRSTFYMHFQDKDELLISSIHDLLRSVQTAELTPSRKRYERIIGFSRPVFEHIHQHRQTGAANIGLRGRAVIHEHLQKVISDLIADDVRKAFQTARKQDQRIPTDFMVQYLASTFILVLNWWVESKRPLPPDEIDALFRSLVLPTLAAATE